jgi:hypothetical protein
MLRFPNSLYGRFFVSLWAVTVLTIGGALALTWLVMSDRPESKPRDATAMFLEAAQTLDSAGEPGLIAWLTRLERDRSPTRVLVIGPDGRELLGRTLPPSVEYALKFYRRVRCRHWWVMTAATTGSPCVRRGPVTNPILCSCRWRIAGWFFCLPCW